MSDDNTYKKAYVTVRLEYKLNTGTEVFTTTMFNRSVNTNTKETIAKAKTKMFTVEQDEIEGFMSQPEKLFSIVFSQAGNFVRDVCTNSSYEACRRVRRWGKRRKRCRRVPTTNCVKRSDVRNIQIISLKMNDYDFKQHLHRTITTCDPASGNVNKNKYVRDASYYISENGTYILDPEGMNIIKNFLQTEWIEKAKYDTSQANLAVATAGFNKCETDYGSLQTTYADLLARFNRLTNQYNSLKSKNEELTTTVENTEQQVETASDNAVTLEQQIKNLENNIEKEKQANMFHTQKYLNEAGQHFQNVEKENKNLEKENLDRGQTNTTFKQKVFYNKQMKESVMNYNYYAFILYFIVLLVYIIIFIRVETKNDTLFLDGYFKFTFFLLLVLYPFLIYRLEKYILNFVNFIYAMFSSKTYNEID